MLLQALRMTRRDWRAGELRFLLLALIVAVSSLSSVSFFVERLQAGLERDAHQLLGADVVVNADQPVASAWRDEAVRRGLQVADTVTFPSMALAGPEEDPASVLVALKAVSPGYPLRGAMKIAPQDQQEKLADGIPVADTVWVDAGLLGALNIVPGDQLQLGDKYFTVAAQITLEPDRGAGFLSFAPRVMMALSDLDATGLVQTGSRVTYRLLVAGEGAAIQDYKAWVAQQIESTQAKGVRIESLDGGQPAMQATLERAEQFLSLVALLSAMLAAVAIAMAARRFMVRHLDACAMLRCLGMTQNQVTVMYLIEFFIVGLLGSIAGAALGFAAHFVLIDGFGALIRADLPSASFMPALQGIATGLVLLVGFALAPVLQLRNVPHNRVMRREQDAPQALTLATYVMGLAAFVGLLLWQTGDVKLGLLTAGGFLLGFAAFALIGWFALRMLGLVRSGSSLPAWRFAVTSLSRRSGATVVQIVALSLGLMALLLLTVIRGDLVAAWRNATPPDAPNRFVINIQPEQKDQIAQRLKHIGVDSDVLYPMIRGRLVRVNDDAVSPDTYQEDRAQRLVNREFNLSTMLTLPPQNAITAGTWLDDSRAEASVEEGLAKTLNLKLGDRMRFDVGGQQVEATVTSLRSLEWGSMRVNFFVILNPSLMRDTAHTWITAFHLPQADADAGFINKLMQDFPNLTIVDVGSIVRQVQTVVDQVITAVEFLFLFTLASGVLVLYAALMGTQDERIRESGLLRAFGATRGQLSQAQWIEFSLVGGLAGLLASSGAALVGWVLASQVFNFAWSTSPLVWIAGLSVGIACAFIGGWFGLRNVLRHPPLQTLRGT